MQPNTINKTLPEIIEKRLNRRNFIRATAASVAAVPLQSLFSCTHRPKQSTTRAQQSAPFPFKAVDHGIDQHFHVSAGYQAQTLLRWGDPVLPKAPPFRINAQSPEAQSQQFGANNDFIAFLPLPFGSNSSTHGLLCVNHEYVNAHMMFPGFPGGWYDALDNITKSQSETLMAACGHSVVEIKKVGNQWTPVQGAFNRRITLLDSKIPLAGPVRGHPRVKTKADPKGVVVNGTLANCSGGVTPWGTVLLCEENIEHYFTDTAQKTIQDPHHERYGLYSRGKFPFYRFEPRFRLNEEPNEANRFGWVIEFDPYNPTKPPVKRTALGRVPREGATTVLDPSGRVVIYSGDDHSFEYLYRFVSSGTYNPASRQSNTDLLDSGTLSVATFNADGTVQWVPLIFGQGPLSEKNGFTSQADVLVQVRQAADLVGATPMDRPEGIAVNPKTGNVYVMLTKNKKRTNENTNGPNPVVHNTHGHILEIQPPSTTNQASHIASTNRWDILLVGGDATQPKHSAKYHPQTQPEGFLANPDNCAFDSKGTLWISTDGAEDSLGSCDGLWACKTDGPHRAQPKRFVRVPQGAELCSPCFTPDETTLFVSVQHPGDSKGSHFASPKNRWPDFDKALPPRPSVVAITHSSGKPIGT